MKIAAAFSLLGVAVAAAPVAGRLQMSTAKGASDPLLLASAAADQAGAGRSSGSSAASPSVPGDQADLIAAFWGDLRPAPAGARIVQLGPIFDYVERPYADQVRGTPFTGLRARYFGPDGPKPELSLETLIERGHADPDGAIRSIPDGYQIVGYGMFIDPKADAPGTYVLEWDGDPDADIISVTGYQQYNPRREPGRITVEFTEAMRGNLPFVPRVISVGDVAAHGPLKFRPSSDRILNDRARAEWSRYDIVRFMDLSAVNGSTQSYADETTSMDDPYWGGGFGWPLRAQVRAAMEADAAAWVHAPVMLGSEGKYVAADPDAALASDEWRKYARMIADAVVAEGYPTDKPILVEAGNEIWNLAPGFVQPTTYAAAIGKRYYPDRVPPSKGDRFGYGRISGALALALDAAFADTPYAGNWRLVIGTWTEVGSGQTTEALTALKDHLDLAGRPDLMARAGVATTGYWRGAFTTANGYAIVGYLPDDAKLNPEKNMYGVDLFTDYVKAMVEESTRDFDAFAKRGADFAIDVYLPDQLGWQKAHAEAAAAFGVPLIGQYEGGSHDVWRGPDYERRGLSPSVHRRWHASDEHARVQRAAAEMFYGAFLDAALSNFAARAAVREWTGGPLGPWSDGPSGGPDAGPDGEWPIARFWDELAGE
ncbi:MAG: hypothetical protein GC152_09460 [Alphaproteobacteria bacterium]|nr:hypothetical protein [Alphaproteobacteria bacterium]